VKFSLVAVVICMILMISCTENAKKKREAVKRLKSFIDLSTQIKSHADKSKLLPFLYGTMKLDLEKMTSSEFEAKFIKNDIEIQRINILEQEMHSDDRVQIAYRLSYFQPHNNGKTKVVAEKVCLLALDEGIWKIKTIFDLSMRMEFPETSSGNTNVF